MSFVREVNFGSFVVDLSAPFAYIINHGTVSLFSSELSPCPGPKPEDK